MVDNTEGIKAFEKHSRNRYKSITTPLKTYTRGTLAKILENYRNGPETLVVVPPIARGGNWLYEWLRANQIAEQNGAPSFLIYREGMDPWLEEFPQLKNLTREKDYVRFRTKRVIGVNQNINKMFSKSELKEFINSYLLSPSFIARQENSKKYVDSTSLVINVRRGDYYSNSAVHHNFGIDTIEYIKYALREARKNLSPSNIVVVSDDLEWCRQNLQFLNYSASTRFEKIGNDFFDDLATLSVANNLILTNTTFGYWGAYIANRDDNCFVYAPNIHQRGVAQGGIPNQHEHNWVQIEPPNSWKSWLEDDN